MNMNRRGFAKLLLGGVIGVAATPLLKVAAIAKAVSGSVYDKAASSFGWMGADTPPISYTDLVTETIRRNQYTLMKSVESGSAILSRWKNNKSMLDVADEWTKEDVERISARCTRLLRSDNKTAAFGSSFV